jgi:hypothetical protein
LLAIALLVAACGGATTSPASTSGEAASAATADQDGPNYTAVGFGTGGTGCTLEGSASTFPVGVPVRTMLELSPALPTGGTITVTEEKDGVELRAPQTITVKEPAPCLYGTMNDLEVGHYRLTYAISPSQMAPATGEFDVTATGSTSDGPTPAGDASLATRIIGRLDALAALAVTDDELLTAQWAIDESEWVTENTATLLEQGGTLKRYADELLAMLDIVAEGADQAPAIGRLLDLRDEIATEFALPTLAPAPTSEP